LTDTDILIDVARRVPEAMQYFSAAQAIAQVQISIISAMELVTGCRSKIELAGVQQFLATVSVIPITENISRTAFRLMVTYRLSHGLLLPDALIAATACEKNLVLRTKNEKHFGMIPALVLERPY